jgi:nicotinamidase/pyrazinamidase
MSTVFFDVDTQWDFLAPAGALNVPGAAPLIPRIVALNQWGGSRGLTVVSTMDAHADDDPEFRQWPAHCVAGTLGQQKPAGTLLDGRAVLPSTPGVALPGGAPRQILVEKQQLDCFSNPNLSALLSHLRAGRYVVYGVVTEYCVRCAAFGLLKTGARVELVTDAIQTLDEKSGVQTLADFTAAGGVLTTSSQVMSV